MESEFNDPDVVAGEVPESPAKETKPVRRGRKRVTKSTTVRESEEIPERISVDPKDEEPQDTLSYVYKDVEQPKQEAWSASDTENVPVEKEREVRPNRRRGSNIPAQQSIPGQYGGGHQQSNPGQPVIDNERRNDPRRKNNNQRNNQQLRGRNDSKPRFAKQIRIGQFNTGFMKNLECFESLEKLNALAESSIDFSQEPLDFNTYCVKTAAQLLAEFSITSNLGDDIDTLKRASSARVLEVITNEIFVDKRPIIVHGVLESIEGGDGLIVYASDNYRIKPQSAFVSKLFIQKYGLRRGQEITAFLHPQTQNATCPFVLSIKDVMGLPPDKVFDLPKFKDLLPYYPTERLFLETSDDVRWDNRSMRIIDLLAPVGLGQRGLIVAPPRTGKTVLLQCIADAITKNRPDVSLIILLIDERPEEVTDFRRQVPNAEIISSTFDESADNHVHAADMVIDKARRKVEAGQHVVILLDSITRLARAHNTEQPSSGKLLSGGVDANALQCPKKFFGSARNIEGGGSLTILATALVETGSRMDEVIFEEFKGTGNMELHLDRTLAEKRMFPAINIEKSGTRKEELLYHPDELEKVYVLRRVLKGVPSVEAMEMLIQRIKQTKTNTEFLLNLNR
ncbi:MAG: transcription termination factor Rho [Opitutales bacterium]|nr:transcription termination factor Rho [Opitutales bacterium]